MAAKKFVRFAVSFPRSEGLGMGEHHEGGAISKFGGTVADTVQGTPYCVKCKAKTEPMTLTVEVNEKTQRRSGKGTCPTCGTKVNLILGKA